MEWEYEEAVLLVDLFNYTKVHNNKEIENAINALSDILIKRARDFGWEIENDFRDYKEISMKLQNIKYIDSNGELGLSSYSFIDEKAYLMSIENPSEFNKLVNEIKKRYELIEPKMVKVSEDIELKIEKEKDEDTVLVNQEHCDETLLEYDGRTYAERFNINPEIYDEVIISVGVQGFSIRTCNRLSEANIHTVGDLLRKKESIIKKIRGFGKKSFDEVTVYLKELQAKTISLDSSMIEDKHLQVSKKLKMYRNDIFNGDFTFENTLSLTPEESKTLNAYKEGIMLVEPPLIEICKDNPEKLDSIYSVLHEMIVEFGKITQKRENVVKILNALPASRLNNNVSAYINAYTIDGDVRKELWKIYGREDAKLKDIKNCDLRDEHCYKLALLFLQWCNFDIENEINSLFEKLYSKDNQIIVLQERSHNYTLEHVGSILGVTRERIRQIEAKARKIFSSWYLNNNILAKISAARNGDNILTYTELQEYFGEYFSEMYYLLKTSEGMPYLYDKQLDIFIVQNTDLSERVQEYVESLPDLLHKNKLNKILIDAEEIGLPTEMLKLAINDKYKVTGDTYHRNRLSLQSIYNNILKKYYKDGIKAYDKTELDNFRSIIFDEFGEVDVPKNNRALTAGIAKIGILCGKGKYKSKEEINFPDKLIEKICKYIDESENVIFLTNTLYSLFEEELLENGIDNKYYLQGILHEKVGDRYIFRRDYISKDDTVTSIYMDVVNFIKKYDYPISKKQVMDAYPGLTEIVFNLSVSDSDIINMFGNYIHADKLDFLDSDRDYFKNVLELMLVETGCVNARDVFDYINKDDSVRLSRLFILQQFSLFSVLEYLFGDSYQFLRPYIAKLGVTVEHPSERLNELIRNSDTLALSEINEFAREMHYQIYSILDYVNKYNDTHLLINDSEIMAINILEIDELLVKKIEAEIISELQTTVFISELKCIHSLPKINVPWTDWLIYSIIKKWSNQLDVDIVFTGTTRQLRYSSPIIAFKGKLNVEEVNMSNIEDEIYIVDDLDNIDDLIADIIVEEIEGK